jgi:hypothetical protein
MKIKSVLIGSAAALAAVSGARAADAIVAAEPEALEYVRVCDAFGTGYFYIPGTETCLKIGGYARFQVDFGRNESGTSDWDANSRGQVELDARSETELGALRGFIGLRADSDNDDDKTVTLHQAFIEVAGFRAGKSLSWWDDDLSGETDSLATYANFNSIRYNFDVGTYNIGISVDELEDINNKFGAVNAAGVFVPQSTGNGVGVAATTGFNIGGFAGNLLGGYDFEAEDGSVRAILTGDFGVGKAGLAAIWSSGVNAYFAESEWTVAAEYAIRATDKLTITPAGQYFWNVSQRTQVNGQDRFLIADYTNRDKWVAGVTAAYDWTSGLSSLATVNYEKEDGVDDQVTGFVRLQRSF